MGVEVTTTRKGDGKNFPSKVPLHCMAAADAFLSQLHAVDPRRLARSDDLPCLATCFQQGDMLTMHYRGTLTNGKQFDASYDRGQPFKFQIGVGQVGTYQDRLNSRVVRFGLCRFRGRSVIGRNLPDS